jgi:hypothetical protein
MMTENCGEKVFWTSEKHIDVCVHRGPSPSAKGQNINIGEVSIIIAAFFGV